MVKTLLILALGVAVGYGYGYKDARKHDKPVFERVLDRAGASARGKYDPDLDKQLDKAER